MAGARYPRLQNYPAAFVWKLVIPTKVCFFFLTLSHKKLLTLDNLKKKGMALANRCELCRNDEESVNQLLVDCPFVRDVWVAVRRACDSVIPPIGDIFIAIQSWPANDPANIDSWITSCVLHYVCWQV
ncbi:unnamed protein product [Linum trigynum]|uniref:Reverse transcriptase zinc-binding domain-containing protein n=1 Tax=Linum trigynum TaxID=586398 RepID=A0AAV2GBJ2_9ROSI